MSGASQQMDIEEVGPSKKKSGQVVKIKEAVPAPVSQNPMAMVAAAMERGVSVDVLEKMIALQERWESNEARKAFDEAVSVAKAKIKPIVRNATGHNQKRYADFSAIAKEVDPILSEQGLSYRFRSDQADGRISITCRLAHKDGHAEETTLSGPADTTGNKNAIQAIGSTTTYLQRYTLVLMLGLAASNDDDGKSAEGDGPISDEQVNELIALADEVGADKAKFCRYAKVDSFADIQKSKFEQAKAALRAKGRSA